MGVGRGGPSLPPDFEIISKKKLFFQFRGVKTKFHHFLPPWKKFWENPLLAPPGKNPSDVHGSIWHVSCTTRGVTMLDSARGKKHVWRSTVRT